MKGFDQKTKGFELKMKGFYLKMQGFWRKSVEPDRAQNRHKSKCMKNLLQKQKRDARPGREWMIFRRKNKKERRGQANKQ